MMRPKRAFIIGLHGRAHQAERSLKVDVDHCVPFLVLHPHGQIVAGDAGVVDQNIELAQRLDSSGNQPFDAFGIGQVARDRHVIAAEFRREGLAACPRWSPTGPAAHPAPPASVR